MTTKRTKDPAGLLPDHIRVDFRERSPEDAAAAFEILKSSTPAARIERLKRHEAMIGRADELAARLVTKTEKVIDDGVEKTWVLAHADSDLLADIDRAESKALYLDAAPKVIRDNKRQNALKQPRRPDIDDWLESQLKADPAAKSPYLWDIAPEWLTDQIGIDRFKKRVTAARKRVAKT